MVFVVFIIICFILAQVENTTFSDMFKILTKYLLRALTIGLFDFKGRTARCGWFIYASLLGTIAIGRIISSLKTDSEIIAIVNIIIALTCLIAYFSVTVRRIHDANFSGWLIIGFVIFPPLMLMTYLPGTKGDNKYGENPREYQFGYLM